MMKLGKSILAVAIAFVLAVALTRSTNAQETPSIDHHQSMLTRVEWCAQWNDADYLRQLREELYVTAIAPTECVYLWHALYFKGWGLLSSAEKEAMISIVWCESHFDTRVYGDANHGGSRGLWQINTPTAASFSESDGGIPTSRAYEAFEVRTNIELAYAIQTRRMRGGHGRYSAWTCRPNTRRYWENNVFNPVHNRVTYARYSMMWRATHSRRAH